MQQETPERRAALAEEERRMRRLKLLVDLTTALLRRHHPLSRSEAYQTVEELRARVVNLFPDKGEVFDLIYWPRFRRLIDDRFGPGGQS